MKNQSENVWGGAQLSYEAPRVDLIQVAVEKGFAQSSFEGEDNDTGASLTGGNAWQ